MPRDRARPQAAAGAHRATRAIAPLGWTVFVEQPLVEAFEPLYAVDPAHRSSLLLGLVLSVAGEPCPRAPHGAPDPRAAGGRRRASARATSTSSIEVQHRRRARGARRAVQPDERPAARVVRRPGAEGRGAHRASCRVAGAADGDRRDPERHQRARRPTRSRSSTRSRERAARLLRGAMRAAVPGTGRAAPPRRPAQRCTRGARDAATARYPAAARRGRVRGRACSRRARDPRAGYRRRDPRSLADDAASSRDAIGLPEPPRGADAARGRGDRRASRSSCAEPGAVLGEADRAAARPSPTRR